MSKANKKGSKPIKNKSQKNQKIRQKRLQQRRSAIQRKCRIIFSDKLFI